MAVVSNFNKRRSFLRFAEDQTGPSLRYKSYRILASASNQSLGIVLSFSPLRRIVGHEFQGDYPIAKDGLEFDHDDI
jgi:hypothetical protein